MAENLIPPIRSWKCSMYKNEMKKWIYGKLQLQPDSLEFVQKGKLENSLKKTKIRFSNIIELRKAKSSLLFSSIVAVLNGQQLWFSSFVNRDEAFNCLDHFWKEYLIESRSVIQSKNPNQELLNIAYKTQEVLVDAAMTIHNQGKQLSNASQMMNSLHNDITVAERITGDIESWIGAWRVKGVFRNPHLLTQRDANILDYESIGHPILFAMLAQESHTPGQLVFKNGNVDILNEKLEIVHSFKILQISHVNVHSPWDVTIIKRNIGRPDIKVHLTSSRMPVLLNIFEQTCQCQFHFDDPPIMTMQEFEESEEIDQLVASDLELLTNSGTSDTDFRHVMLQKSEQKKLNNEDTKELSKVLHSMKSLALDIGVEQDAQSQQIDSLNLSVDRANSRIKSTDWRVKNAT